LGDAEEYGKKHRTRQGHLDRARALLAADPRAYGMDPPFHCITRWIAIPFTVYDFGNPGSWITWVMVACVFTVTVSSR
jgi:hypothetical protein